MFLLSFKWVKRAWEPTEAELLENFGLDAVVFMCIFIFGRYDYIAAIRISYFNSSKPRNGQFNVLVRSIPVIAGRRIRTRPIRYKKLVCLKSKKNTQQNSKRGCCLGICERNVDQYEKKLEYMEGIMRTEQRSVAGKEVPAAFVYLSLVLVLQ
ncbi:hypothetical protein OROGR_026805 [Orobanche gracilis]